MLKDRRKRWMLEAAVTVIAYLTAVLVASGGCTTDCDAGWAVDALMLVALACLLLEAGLALRRRFAQR